MAYCEKPEGTLERCPSCRAAFPLDPEAFEVDGILRRFLRDFFPEDQSAREMEQKENLRQRIEDVHRKQEEELESTEEDDEDQRRSDSLTPHKLMEEDEEGSSVFTPDADDNNHHCCPDCIEDGNESGTPKSTGLSPSCKHVSSSSSSPPIMQRAAASQLNGPLIRSAAEWLNSNRDCQPGRSLEAAAVNNNNLGGIGRQWKACCRHELNVKQGKPGDVDHIAFTSYQPAADSSRIWPNQVATRTAKDTPTSKKVSIAYRSSPSVYVNNILSQFSPLGAGSPKASATANVDVVDSVVAMLLSETALVSRNHNGSSLCSSRAEEPPGSQDEQQRRRSSGQTSRRAHANDDDGGQTGPQLLLVQEEQQLEDCCSSLFRSTADRRNHKIEDEMRLPECVLPASTITVVGQQSPNINDDSWASISSLSSGQSMIGMPYYEAIDDEDDEIEEEYMLLNSDRMLCAT